MLVGKSPAIKNILKLIDIASNCDYPVLICGETGTGKELIACQIHTKSRRARGKFIPLNCASLPETLLISELFGYTKGSFSGATQDVDVLFQIADGGTLFLDEVECMSPRMQQAILRSCELGEVRKIGAVSPVSVNTRIIASSNEDLEALMKNSGFRRDLYHRLNVIKIDVPPLRSRKEDVHPLVDYFLNIIAGETNTAPKKIDPQALELLIQYPWPGNVRELLNTLRSACIQADSDCLGPGDFHLNGNTIAKTENILSIDEYIKDVIKQCSGRMHVKEIARQLGVSRKTLWQWRKKMAG